jgi:hypothetical protein
MKVVCRTALVHKSVESHFREDGRIKMDTLTEANDALPSERSTAPPDPESAIPGEKLA